MRKINSFKSTVPFKNWLKFANWISYANEVLRRIVNISVIDSNRRVIVTLFYLFQMTWNNLNEVVTYVPSPCSGKVEVECLKHAKEASERQ